MLKYIGGIDLPTTIYVVTEPVAPLYEKLAEAREYPYAISWGIHQTAVSCSNTIYCKPFCVGWILIFLQSDE